MSASAPWFRLYHRMVDDEKMRLIAFEDRWHFVALCCLKADGLLDDKSELRDRKIAVKLGVQLRELDEIGRRLIDVGLVDEKLNPVAWSELQFKSDTSTARVEKYRKKQRVATVKRLCNVSVTGQDTDTDTDTEDLVAKATPPLDEIIVSEIGPKILKPAHVIEAWNTLAERHGLPKLVKLTPERRRKLDARLKESTIDEFTEAIAAIDRNPWLRGENDRGWRADFDFLIQPKSFTKLIEGSYDRSA